MQTAENKKKNQRENLKRHSKQEKNSEWQVRWESLSKDIRLLKSTTNQGEVKDCGYNTFLKKKSSVAFSKKNKNKNKVQVVGL